MKRKLSLLSILIGLILGACSFQMPGFEAPTPTATETPFVAAAVPSDTAVPTTVPTTADTAPPPTALQPQPESPTATPLSATAAPQAEASQPTATQLPPSATATATSTSITTFDPYSTYGTPTYENRMEIANPAEWAPPETDRLPDNRNIRLRFRDGELAVTGYRPGFSTWWFSYHTLSDAYIEMTFDTRSCSGEDAYGMIFRGPPHRAGESFGYIVAFTCSGRVWVYRLDGVDPWDAEILVDEDKSSFINTGSGERNAMGVHADGDRFTIFANETQVAEVEDDEFEEGRVGVYVRAAGPEEYTYRLTNFAYWTLGADD